MGRLARRNRSRQLSVAISVCLVASILSLHAASGLLPSARVLSFLATGRADIRQDAASAAKVALLQWHSLVDAAAGAAF